MDRFVELLAAQPVVIVHLASAVAALLLGVAMLTRRKGTSSHRAAGWTWVLLMAVTATSSAFLRDHRLPNAFGFTPIHLFTLITATALPYAVWSARRGHIAAHRATMKGLYLGGCVVAGLFTLLPGRLLGDLVWKHAVGMVA